ncbi:PEP-CTERM sorting domain-containing protein [Duganella sp. BJB488]|nr:PEP-CTERM sorting domain-containing protein [Duganella sp. BJB489]RFP14353.1 PEP-CTERM sorting domain-containing protein [Duganella sp. BJB488]RFP30288.1 PEP-CTERM sorting domain-containing protein [Duganella sp. BJB480]
MIAALLSVTASAANQQYHLSYTSTSLYGGTPWNIEADFTGQGDGDVIRKLQFSSLKIAGLAVNSIDQLMPMYGDLGEAVLSFSGKSNDFWLYGHGPLVDASLYSYTIKPMSEPYSLNGVLYYDDDNHAPGGIGLSDRSINPSWVITAVPEPKTYGMLLLGVGILGAYARRRRAV